MSHTVRIKAKLVDKKSLEKAVKKIGARIEKGTFKLFSSAEEGIGIFLPGWKYPVVVKEDGSIAYDNYNGKWGKQEELNNLIAEYTTEVVKKEYRKKGYLVEVKKDKEGRRIIRATIA